MSTLVVHWCIYLPLSPIAMLLTILTPFKYTNEINNTKKIKKNKKLDLHCELSIQVIISLCQLDELMEECGRLFN